MTHEALTRELAALGFDEVRHHASAHHIFRRAADGKLVVASWQRKYGRQKIEAIMRQATRAKA